MHPQRKTATRRHMGPTITDVAREAGVAIMTVSRVVNGGSYVSPATEKRVTAAIRRLGYQPNEAARMLKGQRAHMIGLVVPDLADAFFATCAHAVQQVAGEHGYMTLIVTSGRSVETESSEIDMMAARRIAGLLIVPTGAHAERLQAIHQAEIPIVALDRKLEGIEAGQVTVENAGGAEEAVRHLIGHGHRRIACIGYDAKVFTVHQRILGYRRAMKAAGLEPELWTSIATAEATDALLRKRLLAPDAPTALFTLNNVSTIYALQTLRKMQLRLPGDLAMIGFDDLELAPLLDPPLTAVRQPALEMGRSAARLIFEMIERPGNSDAPARAARHVMLPTELVIRASCGCAEPLASSPAGSANGHRSAARS